MRTLAAMLLVTAGLSAAQAQQAPFDMTPEMPAVEDATPLPDISAPAEAESADETREQTPPPVPAADIRRHLLPDGNIVLSGENALRSWIVHLTSVQAASPARLHLGYRNAVVVAPESSRLQVLVNNVVVLDEAARSADRFAALEVDIPANLLLAGRNEIAVRARHRHRTDCTIESTYELWTELDAARSFVSFADPAAAQFSGFGDLRALTPDARGMTRVEIVAPALGRTDMAADILHLTQAVALHAAQPNLEFSVANAPPRNSSQPSLRILLGSAEEIAGIVREPPSGATLGPVAAFSPDVREGFPTLVVSGRNREDLLSAINQMLMPVNRPPGTRRDALVTEAWRQPNAPMIYEQRSLSFSELGVRSEQFSGRRFTSSFRFAIPADFYAGSYAEARILLDAAFSADVLPGSLVNVYVNDSIAASLPLTSRNGEIFNRLPVKVTMRHFRPGLNEVRLEAELRTGQDAACLPGAPANDTPRFAIFETSRFVMPDFGRIGQRPNLTATAGTGYPYGLTDAPVAVVMERNDGSTLTAASNFLARIALGAGRPLAFSLTTSTDAARQQDAIFIGSINAIPAGVLMQVGVADESRTAWTPSSAAAPGAQGDERVDPEEWRQRMEGRGLAGWFRGVEDWFSETFGITTDMLRLVPDGEAAFMPAQDDLLLVAQGVNPESNGVWTLLAAPDGAALASGSAALSSHRNWERLAGRLTTVKTDLETVASEPVVAFSFVETQPPTFGNYRLIAANWVSANILSYALLLVLGCTLLGIATSALLTRLGRRR